MKSALAKDFKLQSRSCIPDHLDKSVRDWRTEISEQALLAQIGPGSSLGLELCVGYGRVGSKPGELSENLERDRALPAK
jgi:hypothetical protein